MTRSRRFTGPTATKWACRTSSPTMATRAAALVPLARHHRLIHQQKQRPAPLRQGRAVLVPPQRGPAPQQPPALRVGGLLRLDRCSRLNPTAPRFLRSRSDQHPPPSASRSLDNDGTRRTDHGRRSAVERQRFVTAPHRSLRRVGCALTASAGAGLRGGSCRPFRRSAVRTHGWRRFVAPARLVLSG